MDAQGIFVRICMETQFVLREIAEGHTNSYENSDNDTCKGVECYTNFAQ